MKKITVWLGLLIMLAYAKCRKDHWRMTKSCCRGRFSVFVLLAIFLGHASDSAATEFSFQNVNETGLHFISTSTADPADLAKKARVFNKGAGSAYQVVNPLLLTPDTVNKTGANMDLPSRSSDPIPDGVAISPDDAAYQSGDNGKIPCDRARVLTTIENGREMPVTQVPWQYFLGYNTGDWTPSDLLNPRTSPAFIAIDAALKSSPDGCIRYWYDRLWLTAENIKFDKIAGQKILLRDEFTRHIGLELTYFDLVYPGMPIAADHDSDYFSGTYDSGNGVVGWSFWDSENGRARYTANNNSVIIPNANLHAFFAVLSDADIVELALEVDYQKSARLPYTKDANGAVIPLGGEFEGEMAAILNSYGQAVARIDAANSKVVYVGVLLQPVKPRWDCDNELIVPGPCDIELHNSATIARWFAEKNGDVPFIGNLESFGIGWRRC